NSNDLIDEHLEGKVLTQEEIDHRATLYPEMLVLVKDIKFLSLNGSTTAQLAANEKGEQELEAARIELESAINQKGKDGILKYIALADHLRQKYNNNQEQ